MEHLLHCYVVASTVTAEPTEPLALSTLALPLHALPFCWAFDSLIA